MEVTGEEKRSGAEDEEEVALSNQGGGGDKSGDGPYSNDPARWGDRIDAQAGAYWVKMGPETRQNKSANLRASERIYKHQRRFFQKHISTAN